MIVEHLTSLKFFKPSYKSLEKPHRLLTTTGPFPYEVTKARVQALFLSGSYRTELKWSPNTGGFCQTQMCMGYKIREDAEQLKSSDEKPRKHTYSLYKTIMAAK